MLLRTLLMTVMRLHLLSVFSIFCLKSTMLFSRTALLTGHLRCLVSVVYTQLRFTQGLIGPLTRRCWVVVY